MRRYYGGRFIPAIGECATTGKLQYRSRRAAQTVARLHDDKQAAYLCPDCHNWHTGQADPVGRGQRRALGGAA